MQHLTSNRERKQGAKRRQAAGTSALVLAALPLAISQAFAGQVTAIWDGSSNTDYGTAANWNVNDVPLNNDLTTYIVEIGNGSPVTVNYTNLSGDIDGFLLNANATFNLSSTNLFAPASLTVLGAAQIGGSINATNASFTAMVAGTGFVGNTATISASNGGVVTIGATSYDATGLANRTLLSASGAGSVIDLSSVKSFNSGFTSSTGNIANTVSATAGGFVNLSGVTSLIAPTNNSQSLTFSATSGGSIDLSSVATIAGVTPDSGVTKFAATGGTIKLGPLTSANQMQVDLESGSTMSVGGALSAAALTNSTFTVNGGSVLNGATLVGTDTVRGLANRGFITADGVGSKIDLSGLTKIDSGFSSSTGNIANTVSAADGAVINLSGVTSLIAPTNNSQLLTFSATSGGSIDLSSVATITGVTPDSGVTKFAATGGTIKLGPLTSANQMQVDLESGSTMTVGGAALAALTNSTFTVNGGSVLNGATLVGTDTVRGLANRGFITADGVGSKIDLSGLTKIDSGFSSPTGNIANTVSAADGAVINLSDVTSLIAPTNNSQLLTFSATSGGSIDLSSVATITGVTPDSGVTKFAATGGTIKLGPLTSANQMQVDLESGSTMSVGGALSAAALTNSTFTVNGGSVLNGATLVGTDTVRGLANRGFITADGVGSKIDLSGLTKIDSGFSSPTGNIANTVSAADGAVINLSGVTSLIAPTNNSQLLTFSATSGGSIDLSSVATIAGVTPDSGVTKFAATGGTIKLGPLTSANQMQVDLESGSTMSVGGALSAAALTNSTFTVNGGSVLNGATLVGTDTVRGLANRGFITADGVGSKIDLSGLTKIDSGFSSSTGNIANTVSASGGAVVNLSGVTGVVTPSGTSQSLAFTATTGGFINLAALQSVTSAGTGQLQFNATGGGSILLHGIAAGPGVNFKLTDNNSTLTVAGNFSLLNGSTLSAGSGTHIDIGGNYTFQQTVESQVNTDLATMAFDTSGTHTMEVGGKNISLPTGTTVVQSNFALGELDVGQAATSNKVELVDLVDNGNGSPSEVLYLNGVNGGNGLHILDGSTLVLTEGVDLYATQNGQWTHINDLFKNGATTIAYDQGFITTVPEPGSWLLLLSGIGLIGFRRRASRSAE